MSRCFLFLLTLLSFASQANESVCYGTTENGRLEGGVKLPSSGNNYVGYSLAARVAGRTYVHAEVRDIVVASYKWLETEQPDKVFKYAETGFKSGGKFKPHKTHQNGLSVDFMTPVINSKGKSVHLPTNPLNKLGYNIEFDEHDKFGEFSIDYEALAAHVVALHRETERAGYAIWRVIFDPELQPNLYKTQYGDYLKANVTFSKKRSWVRHDEHYHVDFTVPCKS